MNPLQTQAAPGRNIQPVTRTATDAAGTGVLIGLVNGVLVTILLVPQSLAYAMLAGLPPHVGMYASILPLVAYALLGSSMTLSVGPVRVAARVEVVKSCSRTLIVTIPPPVTVPLAERERPRHVGRHRDLEDRGEQQRVAVRLRTRDTVRGDHAGRAHLVLDDEWLLEGGLQPLGR